MINVMLILLDETTWFNVIISDLPLPPFIWSRSSIHTGEPGSIQVQFALMGTTSLMKLEDDSEEMPCSRGARLYKRSSNSEQTTSHS